ncbi:MAG TPA: cobyric acid synthase [Pirellulaceae bacterium]|nr:cobyric acid synthase [Pirellulaceae bacterium]
MIGRVLMIQGTSSSAGKSLLVAALCRLFARRGVRVTPFKAQNMSNNAAVCADGAEIGRSQALQAAAARIAPTADMNPILLKPEAEACSQVVVLGRPWRTLGARDYFRTKEMLWPIVTETLDRLRRDYELVVIEGAGSPAEMNLRDVEIVNMAVARYCQAPVLLVGDIERGGVFAQLLGTLWLLSDEDRSLVRGLLVNKFRGDVSLFDEGRTFLEQRGGVPVLGVIPWLWGLELPEEDAEVLSRPSVPSQQGDLDIAVIRLPRISNFDDFAPLAAEAGVSVRYVDLMSRLGRPHAVILPGTKSTMSDLEWLRQTGLAGRIGELASQGTHVVGICGGYQMLGQSLRDPQQIESSVAEMPGLGLLPTVTVFAPSKETHQVRGVVHADGHCPGARGQAVDGYEIHMGHTSGGEPWLELARGNDGHSSVQDGAVSNNGRVWGCYLHGLFVNNGFRRAWLNALTRHYELEVVPRTQCDSAGQQGMSDRLDASLNRLADGVEAALDLQRLEEIVSNTEGIVR